MKSLRLWTLLVRSFRYQYYGTLTLSRMRFNTSAPLRCWNAYAVIRRMMFRQYITVVYIQFLRLRLLLTIHAMYARVNRGRKTSDVIDLLGPSSNSIRKELTSRKWYGTINVCRRVNPQNAYSSTLVTLSGSVSVTTPGHCRAPPTIVVTLFGRVNVVTSSGTFRVSVKTPSSILKAHSIGFLFRVVGK